LPRAKADISTAAGHERLGGKSKFRRLIMKTILSALIALSVLGSVAAPASAAWDTKAFWDNLERTQGGGGN
jgi:hypothetical protein